MLPLGQRLIFKEAVVPVGPGEGAVGALRGQCKRDEVLGSTR